MNVAQFALKGTRAKEYMSELHAEALGMNTRSGRYHLKKSAKKHELHEYKIINAPVSSFFSPNPCRLLPFVFVSFNPPQYMPVHNLPCTKVLGEL